MSPEPVGPFVDGRRSQSARRFHSAMGRIDPRTAPPPRVKRRQRWRRRSTAGFNCSGSTPGLRFARRRMRCGDGAAYGAPRSSWPQVDPADGCVRLRSTGPDEVHGIGRARGCLATWAVQRGAKKPLEICGFTPPGAEEVVVRMRGPRDRKRGGDDHCGYRPNGARGCRYGGGVRVLRGRVPRRPGWPSSEGRMGDVSQ